MCIMCINGQTGTRQYIAAALCTTHVCADITTSAQPTGMCCMSPPGAHPQGAPWQSWRWRSCHPGCPAAPASSGSCGRGRGRKGPLNPEHFGKKGDGNAHGVESQVNQSSPTESEDHHYLQCHDDLFQVVKREVDVPRLLEQLPLCSALAHPFAASQVDQAQLAGANGALPCLHTPVDTCSSTQQSRQG